MIVIVCLDDNNGMLFNGRRQSKDKLLREHIRTLVGKQKLWMNAYSAKQFEAEQFTSLQVDEEFLQKVGPGEYCFVENKGLEDVEGQIEKLVVFRWNRVYPADQYLDISIESGSWSLLEQVEFAGHSHEKITREVYGR